ncbi:TPA: alpha/beta hydrolase [Legionella pneumophila]|nr:alpha/beta hydrolase [Legionella pneumophila]HAT8593500.1 alpha/beta hydrolase [Legionella pneumophila]HAU1577571.1 alpha/beta hydrolase [Legionella pneumophila]HAU1681795.1 alpha/beta hydrolase [Legionella pneumophila]HAU3701269.1 alpha/beta hydrolase [Legionella pneumophila]HCR5134693.1 alpha/beta hydrolase [Legionella pneumophila]
MSNFKLVKIEKKFGFYQLKFGSIASNGSYLNQNYSSFWDRLFMLLNLISCLVLLLPNALWSILKISGSMIATVVLYPVFFLMCRLTTINFNLVHSIRDFFGKESIFFILDLTSAPIQIGFYVLGVIAPGVVVKVTSSWWFAKLNGIIITVQEDAVSALWVGILRLIRPKTLSWYSLNPPELTESQKKYPPIFCVHGYRGSQSAWLPLAKHFQKMNYPGAIITIDVPSEAELKLPFAADTPEYLASLNLLEGKINDIMKLYPKDMNSIHLIGHSRGSWVITDVGKTLKSAMRINAISLDNVHNYHQWEPPHTHHHIDSDDYNTSHSGMMFNEAVLHDCYTSIMQNLPTMITHKEQITIEPTDGKQKPTDLRLHFFTRDENQEVTEPISGIVPVNSILTSP